MPNLTTALPRRTGDLKTDYNNLYNCFVSLVDELKILLCNLDSGNVIEAASVKAQNIDAAQARIKDAQITSLTADKLTAGTIDTGEIIIHGSDSETGAQMTMSAEQIVFEDRNGERIKIGADNGTYVFTVRNEQAARGEKNGAQGIYMGSDGRVYMTGDIITDSDCRIQGKLCVGLGADNTANGIEFYALAYNAQGSSWCAKILPYKPEDATKPVGINIITSGWDGQDGQVYVDGKRVLTTDDLT